MPSPISADGEQADIRFERRKKRGLTNQQTPPQWARLLVLDGLRAIGTLDGETALRTAPFARAGDRIFGSCNPRRCIMRGDANTAQTKTDMHLSTALIAVVLLAGLLWAASRYSERKKAQAEQQRREEAAERYAAERRHFRQKLEAFNDI